MLKGETYRRLLGSIALPVQHTVSVAVSRPGLGARAPFLLDTHLPLPHISLFPLYFDEGLGGGGGEGVEPRLGVKEYFRLGSNRQNMFFVYFIVFENSYARD